MKNLIKTAVITVTLVCGFNPLYAGGDHSDGHSHTQKEVSEESVKKIASKKLISLVDAKKIDKIWLNTPIMNMEKKKFNKNLEWVVSFENRQIADSKKQILYVFVSLYGKVTGANFSGK